MSLSLWQYHLFYPLYYFWSFRFFFNNSFLLLSLTISFVYWYVLHYYFLIECTVLGWKRMICLVIHIQLVSWIHNISLLHMMLCCQLFLRCHTDQFQFNEYHHHSCLSPCFKIQEVCSQHPHIVLPFQSWIEFFQ